MGRYGGERWRDGVVYNSWRGVKGFKGENLDGQGSGDLDGWIHMGL